MSELVSNQALSWRAGGRVDWVGDWVGEQAYEDIKTKFNKLGDIMQI